MAQSPAQARPAPIPPAAATPFRPALRLLIALAAAALAGCQAQPQAVGTTGVQAEYGLGRLKAEVDPKVSILALSTAAEIALRERGYAIDSRSATQDRASVVAKRPLGPSWEQVQVFAYQTSSGSGLTIWVTPLGDEVTSRVIMESILTKLGPHIALAPPPQAQPPVKSAEQ